MVGLIRALALAAAAVAPPQLVVCLAQLPIDPCGAEAVPVEATIVVHGASGPATLRWLVDGSLRETVQVELAAGVASRHLLLFRPRSARHRLRLEAERGGLHGAAELEVTSPSCPYSMRVEEIIAAVGRELSVAVVNHGPAPSGGWGIRLLLDGKRAYDSPMDSLAPGRRYELVVPWSDLRGRTRGFRVKELGGRRMIRVTVMLETSADDLATADNVYEVLVPAG